MKFFDKLNLKEIYKGDYKILLKLRLIIKEWENKKKRKLIFQFFKSNSWKPYSQINKVKW